MIIISYNERETEGSDVGGAHEKSGYGGYQSRESDAMAEQWHGMGGGDGHKERRHTVTVVKTMKKI